MPVSAQDYQRTIGLFQSKLANFSRKTQKGTTDPLSRLPQTSNGTCLSGENIRKMVNSQIELNDQSDHDRKLKPHTTALFMMLLSQIRLADNLITVAGQTPLSTSEMIPPVAENFATSDKDNNLPSVLWDPIVETLSWTREMMCQFDPLRFPEASGFPVGEIQDQSKAQKISRKPRYAIFEKKTTTPPPEPDDVKIEKMDFSCIEERQYLSFSDVLRQIGKTLSNPLSELAKESQVIDFTNRYGRCPTEQERANLISITSLLDETISMITGLLPGSQPLMVTQRLGGPLFKMLADSIDNKQLNLDDIFEVNAQLLTLGKSIVDSCRKDSKGKIIEDQLRVPEGLSFKNNIISVNINGVDSPLMIKDGEYSTYIHDKRRRIHYDPETNEWKKTPKHTYSVNFQGVDRPIMVKNDEYSTYINGKRRRISYVPETNEWKKAERDTKTSDYNIYLSSDLALILSGSIDKQTLSSISLDEHGIYTLTSKKTAESFHAIKIHDEFYRYIPDNEKNVSLGGVIKTDKTDIKVSRFDDTYFIINENNKLSVNYSPCRLGRSPGTSCLHISAGVISELDANKENGIHERKIKGLKPSENYAGLYESAKGKLYLKYNDVYFKLKRIKAGRADAKFGIRGIKTFSSKKITPICFSRERGFNYINTPLENMMETAGMSKEQAMSHITTPPKSRPVILGKGSISEVYDNRNGFVEKIYMGLIDEDHKSRLVAANKNAKGFNRYYGDGSGKVSITPLTEGSASVSVNLKKIDGYVLSSVKRSSNPDLLKEIATAIKTSNPSEKLSKSLQNAGIIHYDINIGNIIYNNGEFFIIDFDSANFLPEGDIVSDSQTDSMRQKFQHVFDDFLRIIDR